MREVFDFVMPYTGERACPWNPATGLDVMTHHILRYAWASRYCWQKAVVDVACGTGYGSYLLSWVARHVTGLDIDRATIEYAASMFTTPNCHFVLQDVTKGIPDGHDVYVAFECLEHLEDPATVIDALQDKTLVWSIPVNNNSRYHVRPYSTDEISDMMAGSEFFFQSSAGEIIHWNVAWFDPVYVLGVKRP